MRRITTFIVLALSGLTSAALAARIPKSYSDIRLPPLGQLELPTPERHELSNGLVVFTLENHDLPLVGGAVLLRAGSVYDPPHTIGLAQLTGTTLRSGGAGELDGDALDEWLESRAASIETAFGRETGRITLSCLAEDADASLGVLADMLRRPRFAQAKVELAKLEEASAIARRNDAVAEVTSREFRKLIYGRRSPWASQTEYSSIAAIEREDMLAFHASHVRPDTLWLGLWGDFNTKQIVQRLEQTLGDWHTSQPAPPPPAEARLIGKPSLELVDKADVVQTSIRMGHVGVRWDNPDVYALEVLSEILGSGASSRLFRRVRSDAGLAYSVGAGFQPDYSQSGPFIVFADTKTDSTRAVIDRMRAELSKIREERVLKSELATAKNGLISSFVFKLDSAAEIVNRTLVYAYHDYPLDFLTRYRAGIEAVSVDDLHKAANQYVRPEALATLIVGRTQDLKPEDLLGLGEITRHDISIPPPQQPPPELPEPSEASVTRGRSVLDSAVKALGGRSAFETLASSYATLSLEILNAPDRPPLQSGRLTVYPDRRRTDLWFDADTVSLVLEPDGGKTRIGGKTEAMQAGELRQAREELSFDFVGIIKRYLSDQLQAQHLERVPFAGQDVDVIMLQEPETTQRRVILLINSETSLPVALRYVASGPGGQPAPAEQLFEAFAGYGNVQLPSTILTRVAGQDIARVRVTNIIINPPKGTEMFVRP